MCQRPGRDTTSRPPELLFRRGREGPSDRRGGGKPEGARSARLARWTARSMNAAASLSPRSISSRMAKASSSRRTTATSCLIISRSALIPSRSSFEVGLRPSKNESGDVPDAPAVNAGAGAGNMRNDMRLRF